MAVVAAEPCSAAGSCFDAAPEQLGWSAVAVVGCPVE